MCHLEKKRPTKEVSPNGDHEAFFSCDLCIIENHLRKFKLYIKIIPQIIQFDWTMGVNDQGKVWMAKDRYRGPGMGVKGLHTHPRPLTST